MIQFVCQEKTADHVTATKKGVILAVLHRTGKQPAAIRPRKIFAYLGAKITAILFINKGKILFGSKLPWRLRSFR